MSRPTLIMIWQSGCPTCAILKPLFDRAAAELSDAFRCEKIDISRRRPSYDAEIKTVPSFRLEYECAGKLVAKMWNPRGWDPKTFGEDLERWVTKTAGKCPVRRPKK